MNESLDEFMNNMSEHCRQKTSDLPYSLASVLSKHAINAPYILEGNSDGKLNVMPWDCIYDGLNVHENSLSWKVAKLHQGKKFTQRQAQLDEFKYLVIKRHFQHFEVEIKSIHGYPCSKGELEGFVNVDELVESDDKRDVYIANQVSLIESEASVVENYTFYQWGGRLFYQNTTQPHSLAALKYIASMTNTEVYLDLRCSVVSLNTFVVSHFNDQYYAFLINNAEHDDGFFPDFCEMMLELEVNFILHKLAKKVHQHADILLINKGDVLSDKIAMLFNQYQYQNIGELLSNSLGQQEEVELSSI